MREFLLRLVAGLTELPESTQVVLGEQTRNFYLDHEGYLCNYPGREDQFYRPDGNAPGWLGTPPSCNDPITRIMCFRDVRGAEHICFVQDGELREKYGNGYRTIYTFVGREYDGLFYPDLFLHESKLIIVNFGDPVLIWDGLEGVVPLGVQEMPLPPEVWAGEAPNVKSEAFGTGLSQGYGPWQYRSVWYTGKTPVSGPALNLGADGATRVWGIYDTVVQYFDKYGNHGPVSPTSRTARVKPQLRVQSPAIDPATEYGDTPEWENPNFLMGDCYPPQLDKQVYGIRWGRTLSLNEDGGAGRPGLYYTERAYEGVNCTRITYVKTDGNLASSELIDTEVRGPPTASFGWSWKGRTFLAGLEDPFQVWWSDIALFGQFRITNSWRLRDHFRAGVPIGDRCVLISRSSVETIYETATGEIGVLEQNFGHGSTYGRTFVDVGGAIFGLWNDGFGFYDGAQHSFVDAPYFIKSLYVDERLFINRAIKWGDYYVLSFKKDAQTTDNNYLLLYHLKQRLWYLLDEEVYDLTIWNDVLMGCDDSIYELFKGAYATAATLQVQGYIPPGGSPMTQRNLTSLRLLMEPSSVDETTIEVLGELTQAESNGQGHTLFSSNTAGRNVTPTSYWSSTFSYAVEHEWAAPRDIWATFKLSKLVPGYLHTFKFVFPPGHRVRLKGLAVSFGEDQRTP